MKKRITSNLYTESKICYNNKDGWHYEELKNGFLYSKLKYPTKIKKEDLPESFVYGRYYKNSGYLNAKGVKHLVYKGNFSFNHLHRDDSLYISYNLPIEECTEVYSYGLSYKTFRNYDYVISGSYIIDFVKAVQKYSDIDTTEIVNQLIYKAEWFKENYPDEIECRDIDNHIKHLKKLLKKEKK